jgi:ketosteroid isomerase-like protein
MSSVVAQLLAANAAFYAAFESRSPQAMAALWSTGDDVSCTHPGWAMLHGCAAVQASWERILSGPQHLQFIVSDERAHAEGALGWVTCVENLLAEAGPQGSTAAMNLFRREPEGTWRMVAHHASPVLQRP